MQIPLLLKMPEEVQVKHLLLIESNCWQKKGKTWQTPFESE
jgi:hypothetical protein